MLIFSRLTDFRRQIAKNNELGKFCAPFAFVGPESGGHREAEGQVDNDAATKTWYTPDAPLFACTDLPGRLNHPHGESTDTYRPLWPLDHLSPCFGNGPL